jgi:cysteine-rich repeat protein
VVCGDGVRVDPEICDDGNLVNGDGCDANCAPSDCGNGMKAPGEQCDDGNTVDGDGCDSNCKPTGCGNGVVTGIEQCDDGNAVNDDGCTNGCKLAACGDGILQAGEQCDDGNAVDGDGCSASCIDVPVSISCDAPAADLAFDAFKIGGQDVQFMSGIWGTDNSNVYIAASTYGQGAIAHWMGGPAWVNEPLPTSSQNQASQLPSALNGIHGVDDDHVCVVGQANFAGYMACRSAGTWGLDIKAESLAKNLTSVWIADLAHAWIVGNTAAQSVAWLKTGANWAVQSFPSGPLGIDPAACNFRQIWGLDSGDVFIVGDQNGVGILLRFNGSSWVRVQTVPNTITDLRGVTGSSVNDVYVSGQDTSGHGVIYHVTNNLTVWTSFSNGTTDSYVSIVSPKPQAAVTTAMGTDPMTGLPVTEMTAIAQAATTQNLPSPSYGVGGMWTDSSTGKVYMGTFGRLFKATCN